MINKLNVICIRTRYEKRTSPCIITVRVSVRVSVLPVLAILFHSVFSVLLSIPIRLRFPSGQGSLLLLATRPVILSDNEVERSPYLLRAPGPWSCFFFCDSFSFQRHGSQIEIGR